MSFKNRNNAKRQEMLEKAARLYDPIAVKGSRHSDSSDAVWNIGDGKTASFTIGEVKAKREELEQQC